MDGIPPHTNLAYAFECRFPDIVIGFFDLLRNPRLSPVSISQRWGNRIDGQIANIRKRLKSSIIIKRIQENQRWGKLAADAKKGTRREKKAKKREPAAKIWKKKKSGRNA